MVSVLAVLIFSFGINCPPTGTLHNRYDFGVKVPLPTVSIVKVFLAKIRYNLTTFTFSLILTTLPAFWIVTEFKTYNNSSKPYVTVRNLQNGETVKTKIKKAKIFDATPFTLYSILIFNNFSYEHKHKKVDGKWIETDETEPILSAYDVLREGDVC